MACPCCPRTYLQKRRDRTWSSIKNMHQDACTAAIPQSVAQWWPSARINSRSAPALLDPNVSLVVITTLWTNIARHRKASVHSCNCLLVMAYVQLQRGILRSSCKHHMYSDGTLHPTANMVSTHDEYDQLYYCAVAICITQSWRQRQYITWARCKVFEAIGNTWHRKEQMHSCLSLRMQHSAHSYRSKFLMHTLQCKCKYVLEGLYVEG